MLEPGHAPRLGGGAQKQQKFRGSMEQGGKLDFFRAQIAVQDGEVPRLPGTMVDAPQQGMQRRHALGIAPDTAFFQNRQLTCLVEIVADAQHHEGALRRGNLAPQPAAALIRGLDQEKAGERVGQDSLGDLARGDLLGASPLFGQPCLGVREDR